MTDSTAAHCRLTGRLTVALPPDEAFRLFTPRGEEDWVPHWKPAFPASVIDDSAPGTVFVTRAHDTGATWVVIDRVRGRRIRYARVIPQTSAGIVDVVLDGVGQHSDVTVTYELTALSETGRHELQKFAETYPDFLKSWEDAIAAWLHESPRTTGHG